MNDLADNPLAKFLRSDVLRTLSMALIFALLWLFFAASYRGFASPKAVSDLSQNMSVVRFGFGVGGRGVCGADG